MTFSSLFTGSLLAGILIALGDIMYVYIENKIVAAFLFSIALCFIRVKGLNLFTGSLEKFYSDKGFKWRHLFFILILNIIGTCIMHLWSDFIFTDIYALAEVKFLNVDLWRVYIYSILCGMLMAVATDSQTPMWLTIMCVMGFLLSGFRHSIADSWYFWHLPIKNWGTGFGILGLEILGNFLGGTVIALLIKENLANKIKSSLKTKNL